MSKTLAVLCTLALSTCGSTAVPLVDRALREKAEPVVRRTVAAALRDDLARVETFSTRMATLFDAPSLDSRVQALGRAAEGLRAEMHPSVTVFALGSDGHALASAGPEAVAVHDDVLTLVPEARPTLLDGHRHDAVSPRPVAGHAVPHRLLSVPVRNHGVIVGAFVVLAPLDALVDRVERDVRRTSDLLTRAEVCLALGEALACGEAAEGARAILETTSLGASGTRVERHGTGGSASLVLVTKVDAGEAYEALVWAPAY